MAGAHVHKGGDDGAVAARGLADLPRPVAPAEQHPGRGEAHHQRDDHQRLDPPRGDGGEVAQLRADEQAARGQAGGAQQVRRRRAEGVVGGDEAGFDDRLRAPDEVPLRQPHHADDQRRQRRGGQRALPDDLIGGVGRDHVDPGGRQLAGRELVQPGLEVGQHHHGAQGQGGGRHHDLGDQHPPGEVVAEPAGDERRGPLGAGRHPGERQLGPEAADQVAAQHPHQPAHVEVEAGGGGDRRGHHQPTEAADLAQVPSGAQVARHPGPGLRGQLEAVALGPPVRFSPPRSAG